MPGNHSAKIIGDVAATADVQYTDNGASLIFDFGRKVRNLFGTRNRHWTGAALGVGDVNFFIVTGDATKERPIIVRRTGAGNIEIGILADDDVEVDVVEAAFLRLKCSQFGKDALALSDPMTSAQWHDKMEALTADLPPALAGRVNP